MRLRINELLAERNLTPYALSRASKGRVGMRMAYRLAEADGAFATIKASVLEALCDVLRVDPGDLFERGGRRPGNGVKKGRAGK